MRTLRALSHWIGRIFDCLTHLFFLPKRNTTARSPKQYRYACCSYTPKYSLFFPLQQGKRVPVRIRTQRIW
jgi:hypothetical protein